MLDPRFTDAASRLPDYFGSHIAVSLTALAVGLAISIPLSLASLRRPRLRTALLTSSSIVQTIPGLALLALFYPLLLALTALSQRFLGVGFSALGFLPAVLALALYSMLPVVRNTITGIEGIDPAAKRAAIGVGMTERQSLRMVELPLALPIIMAGIRTAAVLVIGTATLSTPIGQTSLGNYIFTGLQTQNWLFVLFGCVSAAVLALVVDQLLALLERAYSRRDRRLAVGGFAGLAAVALLAIAPAIAARGTAASAGHASPPSSLGSVMTTEPLATLQVTASATMVECSCGTVASGAPPAVTASESTVADTPSASGSAPLRGTVTTTDGPAS